MSQDSYKTGKPHDSVHKSRLWPDLIADVGESRCEARGGRSLNKRLLVIAYCGPQGQRQRALLISIMKKRLFDSNMLVVANTFIAGCSMC